MLGFAGGYISEAFGGSYAFGWGIGSIVGGILGGQIYQGIQHVKAARALTCMDDAFISLKIDEFTIKSKHLNYTGGDWAKFNVGTELEAKVLVKETLKNGEILKIGNNKGIIGSMGQKSFDAYINAGKIIGTQGQTTIKIVYDQYGTIWTLFPK